MICGNVKLSKHLENRIIIRNIKIGSGFFKTIKKKLFEFLHFKLAK